MIVMDKTDMTEQTTLLTQSLGLQHPLIQAPMAGVQGSALAISVCQAGALGSLPAAMLTPQALALELQALACATNAAFNVNFFCHTPPEPSTDTSLDTAWREALEPYCNELGIALSQAPAPPGRMPFSGAVCDVIGPFKPRVVSFHFGLPSAALVNRVKAWGAQVWASATTVDEARWLQAHGADVVIAQGLEAGGHRGHFLSYDLSLQCGTFALLPQIVAAVNVPVVAAGGIACANGVRAALALGASAVQVGTAFLLCHEATTSSLHRAELTAHTPVHTELTRIFTGRPARGIQNRIMRELGAMNPLAPPFPLATHTMGQLRASAEQANNSDFSPMWSGQNTSGCAAITAQQMVRRLCAME